MTTADKDPFAKFISGATRDGVVQEAPKPEEAPKADAKAETTENPPKDDAKPAPKPEEAVKAEDEPRDALNDDEPDDDTPRYTKKQLQEAAQRRINKAILKQRESERAAEAARLEAEQVKRQIEELRKAQPAAKAEDDDPEPAKPDSLRAMLRASRPRLCSWAA